MIRRILRKGVNSFMRYVFDIEIKDSIVYAKDFNTGYNSQKVNRNED